ncbi:DUF4293 domain-containing protein [Arcticibacterium luteifluviistationis]|uniref:DUF4293 domain-containing protein n=1 Tax=Arcticibacterium luteifluviistationis TaxID=1784714 RepID=A0A2Z4GEF9_9BACT|nr:DUF4293 domain-containing protein [Arcticibacterium luteifluviistationis]AWV99712.1 DUF4293 domain-containing protein [Arcticibacterium luteifluviistationis]
MLQRIQSALLLLSAIALGVFLSTNMWTSETGTGKVIVNPYHVLVTQGGLSSFSKDIFYIAVMAALAIVLAIFTIFQYKNRVRQMLFVALNSLLIGAAVAVGVYHVKYDGMTVQGAGEGNFDIGIYAGFAALALNWLANRFIKKDDKLVKSADRMR